MGADAPGPEKLPAGTSPQSAEELDPLLGLYVPASQGVCVIEPFVSTKYPALAFVHATWPVTLFHVPSPHGVCVVEPFVST